MTINLADNDPRNEYTVTDGNSQTVFTMDFEIFDNADLNVYVDGVLQTLTTHYKISDVNNDANAGHTSGTDGFVHFTSAVTASGSDKKIVLTRSIALQRVTDFPSAGPFDIASLNTELDRVTAIQADLKDDIDRSLRLTDFDLDATLTLPAVDTRKGKTLAFNATTGAVEAGPSIGDVQTVSAASTDIATLADIQDGTTATNAITTVSGISANVTTVAGISSNVTTVAGQVTNLNNVTSNLTAIQNAAQNATDAGSAKTAAETAQAAAEAALDTFTDRFLGTFSSNPTLDNDGNALLDGAIYFNTTDNVMKVYDLGNTQWIALALTGTDQTNVNTVAGQISPTNNISTVAGAINAGSFASATTFASKYRVGASDPTDSLDAGDLFYNTTSNTLKVYNGSGWVDATLQGATITTFEYTATAGQTAFTGNDNNGVSLNYNTANLLVTINGVIIPSSDYTTTSTTTLTLDADAAAEVGDSVVIISYSEFTASNSVTDISGDTTPTLGGNLDVGGNSIVSTSDGDINITPNGTGKVKVDNLSIDGNTIAVENTDGDLILQANGIGDVEINLDGNGSFFNINYDSSGSSTGPHLALKRTSSSPADFDDLGKILFQGQNSSGTNVTFASIEAEADDVSTNSENGSLKFNVAGDSVPSGTAAFEIYTAQGSSAGTNLAGKIRIGNESVLEWADHKGTTFECTLDWETPTQANTISFPNATGTLGYVALSTTSITSDTATIDIDNLPDEFDSFVFHINAHPVSDTVTFNARFIDTSGNAIADANTYAYYRPTDGNDTSSDGSTVMQLTAGTIGTSTNEGVKCDLLLQGRSFSPDAEVVPPTLQGHVVGHYNNSAVSGGPFYGFMQNNNAQAIRGIQFLWGGSTDVAKATIHVYGIQNT